MANALYDKGREGFLDGSIDWDTDAIRADLIDEADDTIDLAVDDNRDDRAAAAIEEQSGDFASKTVTAGVADAADVTWTAAAGDPCESIDIYLWTGANATSRLIANIDTATGLPVTLNGGDVTAQWDSGANKIFKL
jgi:hypothetical protein